MQQLMGSNDLLWPACDEPDDLARIEAIPLADRGLPETTYELVVRAAAMWPDQAAMSFIPDAEHWEETSTRTFAELADDVHRAAHVLSGLGVGRRDAVALLSPNCEQLVTAILAAEAVGVAAPINPALAAEHAQHLLELSDARVIIAAGPELSPETWELGRQLVQLTHATTLLAVRPVLAPTAAPPLDPIDGAEVAYFEALCATAPSDGLPVAPPNASDFASYLHTGGTTGRPKLAVRTHANEVINTWMIGASFPRERGSAIFAALPLFHTNALLVTLFAPLFTGHHVVWAGPLGYRDTKIFDTFWKLIARYRIASMSGVPTIYATLARLPVDADISSLRYPLVGSSPLPRSVAEAFRSRTGTSLCEGYGLTEGTCATARNFPAAVQPGSVGQRLPYQDVRAARIDEDTQEWEFLPAGEVGTIVLRGPNVFAGYLTPTDEGTIVDSRGKIKDGWLDTGDLGSVDANGYLWLVGRVKDLIIRGGHNIDPAVIEDALLEHPGVAAAAAIGAPDAHSGEVPVVYVALTPGAEVDEHELQAWATERVPERAAAPKRVEIVDAIPLTAVGKPFKPELRRHATERVAAEALPQQAVVTARLVGSIVQVEISGITEDEAEAALGSFAFARNYV